MNKPIELSGKSVEFELLFSITEVDKEQYDSIQPPDNPFFEFDFLFALEKSRCVGPRTGWEPRYLLLRDGKTIAAAVTFYLKTDSYGEYIFDWQWAQAYQDAGLSYYPKVVVGVPFTPTTGSRLIVNPDYDYKTCAMLLAEKLVDICSRMDISSVHFLFITREEQEILGELGFLPRISHQYHWHNSDYGCFDDFLGVLRSGKRKQIKKERRRLYDSGVNISILEKDGICPEDINCVWEFYLNTNSRKWGNVYLNRHFFEILFRKYRERTVLFIASRDGSPVGGTINFRKGKKLYGRYWGCVEDIPYLHFECCYYKPIEYAISNGISVFEAGAQGEHKFLRGFCAVPVNSSHLFFNRAARAAIDSFLRVERPHMRSLVSEYNRISPVKKIRGEISKKII